MDPSGGGGQGGAAAADYERFVRACTPALIRTAYLLTGDQQLAEDLVQEALARTHVAWHRLQGLGNADAYVRKVMYHQQVSMWRRRRVAESLPGTLSEAAVVGDHTQATTTRIILQQALRDLSPRQRAVIVLRYFEDRTEVETAELLGLAVGTVKTLALRGLTRLRTAAAELRELDTDGADR